MPDAKAPMARVHVETGLRGLDPQEEKEYAALRLLGRRLHVPIVEALWELEVLDGDGKTVTTLQLRSHSFVRNAYNHLLGQLAAKDGNGGAVFGGGFLNIKDTGGTVRTGTFPILTGHDLNSTATSSLDAAGSGPGIIASAGVDTKGIVVGSGSNAENFEDFALQNKILNGTTAGKLSYIQSEAPVTSYDAGSRTLTVTHARFFNNNSGGNVDVNEVGIHLLGKAGGSQTSNITWMVARDKLGATVTVPNTGQLKVTYTISLAYPA